MDETWDRRDDLLRERKLRMDAERDAHYARLALSEQIVWTGNEPAWVKDEWAKRREEKAATRRWRARFWWLAVLSVGAVALTAFY